MSPRATTRAAGIVLAALSVLATPAAAQEEEEAPGTTPAEVRQEIADAMEAVSEYSAQERDEALERARDGLDRLDAEIARREQALRENWAGMSDTAREEARSRLEELRAARNRLGERYGALQAGARDAWGALRDGFSDAWGEVSEAWSDSDANGGGDTATD